MPATAQVVIRFADTFRSEIRQAQQLGCKLEIRTEAHTAYARVVPTTATARAGMRIAALQDGAPGRDALEVRQNYERREDLLDAVSAAIAQALDIARTALA